MIEMPAFSGFYMGKGDETVMYCLACKQEVNQCDCVWAAVRALQKQIGQCIDCKMINSEIGARTTWQTGCEGALNHIHKELAAHKQAIDGIIQGMRVVTAVPAPQHASVKEELEHVQSLYNRAMVRINTLENEKLVDEAVKNTLRDEVKMLQKQLNEIREWQEQGCQL